MTGELELQTHLHTCKEIAGLLDVDMDSIFPPSIYSSETHPLFRSYVEAPGFPILQQKFGLSSETSSSTEKSFRAFCKTCGLSNSEVMLFQNLLMGSRHTSTCPEFVSKVCSLFEMSEIDLFPPRYYDSIDEHRIPFSESSLSIEDEKRAAKMLYDTKEGVTCEDKIVLIEQLLTRLPDVEEKILRLRLGFIDERNYSRPEIAEQLQLSVAQIQYLESQSLKELKHVLMETDEFDDLFCDSRREKDRVF